MEATLVQDKTSYCTNVCICVCEVTGQRYRDWPGGDRELLLFIPRLLRAGGDAHLFLPEAPPRLQLPESVRETPAAAGPAVHPLSPGPDPRPVQVGERRTVNIQMSAIQSTLIFHYFYNIKDPTKLHWRELSIVMPLLLFLHYRLLKHI